MCPVTKRVSERLFFRQSFALRWDPFLLLPQGKGGEGGEDNCRHPYRALCTVGQILKASIHIKKIESQLFNEGFYSFSFGNNNPISNCATYTRIVLLFTSPSALCYC